MKMLPSYIVITTTGYSTHTLLERLWIGIILRNVVTGRLGTAWFNCGVAINAECLRGGTFEWKFPSPEGSEYEESATDLY
jgi:hypothetical protein